MDNQPDFTWLKPFEKKVFRQYFMPYKGVGQVKNATTEAAVGLSYDGAAAEVKAYATSVREGAVVKLWAAGQLVLEETACISPVAVYEAKVPCSKVREDKLRLAVYSAEGECLAEYRPEAPEIPKLPEPAKAAKEPEEQKALPYGADAVPGRKMHRYFRRQKNGKGVSAGEKVTLSSVLDRMSCITALTYTYRDQQQEL